MTATLTRAVPTTYAATAARGMLASLAHYGNRQPAVGDGRVSTPAWYANRLGKVLHARGETLPGEPTEWWGNRYAEYARHLVALLDACHVCSGPPHPDTFDPANDRGHNYWSTEAAFAEAREAERRYLAAGGQTTEARYVAQHRPY